MANILTALKKVPEALEEQLIAGCLSLGLELSVHQRSQLLEYICLLERWNKVFNLTAIRDPLGIVSHHILDSLSVLPHLQGRMVLDIGSGAGLPGVPLAVVSPDRHFTLLDSNSKKTRFLKQVVLTLSLDERINIVKSRIEQYRPAQSFDTVICRAFSNLDEFVRASAAICSPQSRLLAMKGRRPDAELESLDSNVKVLSVTALSVPGLAAERHLITLQRTC